MNSENGVGPATVPVLEKQVEQILAEAKKQGATACEVSVSTSQSLAVTVRQKEVETLEFNRDRSNINTHCSIIKINTIIGSSCSDISTNMGIRT